MDISKKELLEETGISYGQLYRWKREGLIPESWFVKKSSFTGQETYFPKEKILKRIRAIQQLKDQYSLEELADLLSPEVSNRTFSEEDLEVFEEIDIDVAATFMDAYEKDSFSFVEVLVMMVFSEWRLTQGLNFNAITDLIHNSLQHVKTLTSVEHRLLLLCVKEEYYTLIISEHASEKAVGSGLWIDERMQIVKQASLLELSNNMKVKYKNEFHFTFDEEVADE